MVYERRIIASSYECPKCNEQMGLNERKSVVLDGFEWRCRKKGVNTHDKRSEMVIEPSWHPFWLPRWRLIERCKCRYAVAPPGGELQQR
ncbi:hypothetical protein TNCV_3632391 [Trichonephila clavipes]|nr:hypothetical protein TNCV_3632391 [Trichonephila clavipes]